VDQRTLVERARKGDRDAFALLVRPSGARLDAAARLILRDRELARDAVQEALIRAWRDLPGLRDPERFDAWLHRLIVNAAIDEARRRRRRVIEVDTLPVEVASSQDDFDRLVNRDELDRALGTLTPEHRALVVLHYYLGVSLPEAASSLGISLSAAKSRLHRAIGAMRQSFSGGRP
jgi:RNA polymerase sigma-70 factor, ECF subfamily